MRTLVVLIILSALLVIALPVVNGQAAISPVSPISTTPPGDWGRFYDCWLGCVWLEDEAFTVCGERCAESANIDPWLQTEDAPIIVPGRTPAVCYPLYARYPVRCTELKGEAFWEVPWWNIWWPPMTFDSPVTVCDWNNHNACMADCDDDYVSCTELCPWPQACSTPTPVPTPTSTPEPAPFVLMDELWMGKCLMYWDGGRVAEVVCPPDFTH